MTDFGAVSLMFFQVGVDKIAAQYVKGGWVQQDSSLLGREPSDLDISREEAVDSMQYAFSVAGWRDRGKINGLYRYSKKEFQGDLIDLENNWNDTYLFNIRRKTLSTLHALSTSGDLTDQLIELLLRKDSVGIALHRELWCFCEYGLTDNAVACV